MTAGIFAPSASPEPVEEFALNPPPAWRLPSKKEASRRAAGETISRNSGDEAVVAGGREPLDFMLVRAGAEAEQFRHGAIQAAERIRDNTIRFSIWI